MTRNEIDTLWHKAMHDAIRDGENMTRTELDALWHKAMHDSIRDGEDFTRYHFAALVAAAKEQQIIAGGWRHCARGQRTTQFCGLAEQAIAAEREACARIVEQYTGAWDDEGYALAQAIRARGSDA